jgi:hypothetical protein
MLTVYSSFLRRTGLSVEKKQSPNENSAFTVAKTKCVYMYTAALNPRSQRRQLLVVFRFVFVFVSVSVNVARWLSRSSPRQIRFFCAVVVLMTTFCFAQKDGIADLCRQPDRVHRRGEVLRAGELEMLD